MMANNCPHCTKALRHLSKHRHEFQLISVEALQGVLELVDQLAEGSHPEFILMKREVRDNILKGVDDASARVKRLYRRLDMIV